MFALNRFTTEYCPIQDRIRLIGEGQTGSVQVWLTRRLLDRLIPLLIEWLPQAEGVPANGTLAEMISEFHQQVAQSSLVPQSPVMAMPTMSGWLAESVDVNRAAEHLAVVMKTAGQSPVGLTFSAVSLRQWIGILHTAYLRADWPEAKWPDWIRASSATQVPGDSAMRLH